MKEVTRQLKNMKKEKGYAKKNRRQSTDSTPAPWG
jgi:hypothetical protein